MSRGRQALHSNLTCVWRRRAPDHDHVEPRPADEEAAPLKVEAVGGLPTEEPVHEHYERLLGLDAKILRIGTGHDQGDPSVQDRNEELVLTRVSQDIVHRSVGGQAFWNCEESPASFRKKGPERRFGGTTLVGVEILEDDTLALQEARVPTTTEPSQDGQGLGDVPGEPLP